MLIGRNDRCPCGSGRKYKKCHGALDRGTVESTAPARATVLKARDVKLAERLIRFARIRYGPEWLQDTLDGGGLLVGGEVSDAEMPIVIPWLQHFRSNTAGFTLAEEWQRHERPGISLDERLVLDAYDAAWLSLWEVVEVTGGIGSQLTDVLTGEQRFVHDISSSSTLRRFDTVLAIVLTCDGVSFFGGVHAQPLPPRFAEHAARQARRLCRVRTRPVSVEKLRDPDTQVELLALWNVIVENATNRPPPVLQNTDGDPFQLTKDDFAVVAPRDEVVRQLLSLPGVQVPLKEGDDTVFVVMKVGNAVHRSWDNTIIGRMVLSGARLTLETNSTRRADTLRSAVETQLRGLARFRMRKEENTAKLIAAAQASVASRDERGDEQLPPETAAALREFRERHMRDWLDDAIPALGGLTPREAAQSARARPKLETLLKEFEQSEAALPEQQRIDLRSLREVLGFHL